MPGKRAARRRPDRSVLAALMAAGLLACVLAWSLFMVLRDGGVGTDDADSAGEDTAGGVDVRSGPPTDDTRTEGGDAESTLQACSAEVASAERVVSAAQSGVRHWSAHVRARTDMLKGRITEKQMDAVWKRTQDAGPADQRRFHDALQQYGGRLPCADPRSETQTEAMTACVTRSETATTAVVAAQEAMDAWSSHLHHMATYADGGMTSGKAQRLWVIAWREAPEHISTYRDSRKALQQAPSCARG
jgi:hypothetical protein